MPQKKKELKRILNLCIQMAYYPSTQIFPVVHRQWPPANRAVHTKLRLSADQLQWLSIKACWIAGLSLTCPDNVLTPLIWEKLRGGSQD